MKALPNIFAGLLCLCFSIFNQAYAETENYSHHKHGPAELSLDHGKKWPTDEPLRKGMEKLRIAFAKQQVAIHEGYLSTDEYKTLGETIENEVDDIIAQCKLEPMADEMLHFVIADMIAGADIMMGKTKGNPLAGAHTVISALNNYGRYFDHPGWHGLG